MTEQEAIEALIGASPEEQYQRQVDLMTERFRTAALHPSAFIEEERRWDGARRISVRWFEDPDEADGRSWRRPSIEGRLVHQDPSASGQLREAQENRPARASDTDEETLRLLKQLGDMLRRVGVNR